MITPLYHVGDLVLIDDKDKAFIVEVDEQSIVDGCFLYKVKYLVGGQEENNVKQNRCKGTILSSLPT